MKLHDFECDRCHTIFEKLVSPAGLPPCPECFCAETVKLITGTKQFSVIVPTTLDSKKRKAGYVHLFQNRPAEKISVQVPAKVKDA